MAATLLSGASLYAQATTYVYTGNPFTNVSGVYTASDLISGYITLSTPLKDNISNASVVPAGDVRSYVVTFEFSDGAYIWSPTNSYVNTGIFSTDSNGDFSVWTLGLQGYAPPLIDCGGACFGYLQTTNDLPTVDGVSANDLTGNFGQGDGSNGFPNSPPDPGSWVVATKDSPLFCPSGANGSGNNYYPTKAHCDSGAVVPWGFLLCPAGADGRAGSMTRTRIPVRAARLLRLFLLPATWSVPLGPMAQVESTTHRRQPASQAPSLHSATCIVLSDPMVQVESITRRTQPAKQAPSCRSATSIARSDTMAPVESMIQRRQPAWEAPSCQSATLTVMQGPLVRGESITPRPQPATRVRLSPGSPRSLVFRTNPESRTGIS